MGNIAFSRGCGLANWNKIKATGDKCVMTKPLLLCSSVHMHCFKMWGRSPQLSLHCLGGGLNNNNLYVYVGMASIRVLKFSESQLTSKKKKKDGDGCQHSVFMWGCDDKCTWSQVFGSLQQNSQKWLLSHSHNCWINMHPLVLKVSSCCEQKQQKVPLCSSVNFSCLCVRGSQSRSLWQKTEEVWKARHVVDGCGFSCKSNIWDSSTRCYLHTHSPGLV